MLHRHALLALSLALFALPAWSQVGGDPTRNARHHDDVVAETTDANPAASGTPTEAPLPAPPPELANPRATMETFLGAFAADEQALDGRKPLAVAASCLDLDELPIEARALAGPELAIRLKNVIDRIAFVDFDQIPDAAAGPPWIFYRGPGGSVAIGRGEDGAWRFTEQTIESIDALEDELRGREVVEGVVAAPRTVALILRDAVPAPLRNRALGLELWQWIGLGVLALLGVVLDRIAVALAHAALARVLARRDLAVEREQLERGLRPAGLLVAALVWSLGLRFLALPPHALALLLLAARVVATATLVWTAWRLVDVLHAALASRAARSANRFDDLLVPLASRTLKVLVAVGGVVIVAESFDLEIGGLLAGLGIGGVALALASKDTVENLFGSFTVLLDRPFHVGDWVVIGDVEGNIEEVGFRSTRIRTFYDSQVTLPNSTLIRASVDNYGARRYRRWKTVLSIAYDTPPERIEAFCAAVRELVRERPQMRREKNYVVLNEYGASSLDILLYVFFDCPDWSTELELRHHLALDIVRVAAELGVEFAFPTRTLWIRRGEATEPQPGDPDWPTRASDASDQARQIAARVRDA